MLSARLEQFYKSRTLVRYDERDTAFYFSYTDFDGINMERYSFKNKWGEGLSGYFYYPDEEIEGRIVIFEHGLGAGHRSYMREIAMLVSHGYRVLAYDRTGCASSPGESAKGLVASLCDLDFCLRALKSDAKYASYDFSVVGHSWGGFSSMNIAAYHPDVSHIVAMSGFRSLEAMLMQQIPSFLKRYRKHLFAVEEEISPEYANASAENALSKTSAQVLIIHSADDPVVSCKMHFDALKQTLSERENIRFLRLNGKAHNPNYTESAVKYLKDYSKKLKRNAKKLVTPEQKHAFLASFDWHKITEQDDAVWQEIFKTLDK